ADVHPGRGGAVVPRPWRAGAGGVVGQYALAGAQPARTDRLPLASLRAWRGDRHHRGRVQRAGGVAAGRLGSSRVSDAGPHRDRVITRRTSPFDALLQRPVDVETSLTDVLLDLASALREGVVEVALFHPGIRLQQERRAARHQTRAEG